MIKFLMSIFRAIQDLTSETRSRILNSGQIKGQEPLLVSVESEQDADIIDYDGMGNQGRFPTIKNKKRGRK